MIHVQCQHRALNSSEKLEFVLLLRAKENDPVYRVGMFCEFHNISHAQYLGLILQ